MTTGIQLIVGLGNPGQEYEQTRHNAGAWFVLDLADSLHLTLRPEKKYQAMHLQTTRSNRDLHLLIPTTFMNLSGQSVKSIMSYYKILPEALLVVHDEIDLPVGEIRLKFDGGHGGHNGLRDIIRHISTTQFHRLRIGVGRPTHSKEVIDYVLNPPKKQEREIINTAMHTADAILPLLLDGEFRKQ